ncbi:AAA family ATPase [Aeromicrobium sp. YC3-14]|nr:AAA family ATPase [Aeromicrobium stalagmiti]
MFYAGKVHTIASESEAGKTWLMLSACIDEMTAGNHVVYLDFEDDEGGLVRRLLGLQCNPEVIRARFHYVKPSTALGTGINADDLREVMAVYKPTLTVIDGVTEAMTMHGMDPLSNKDIATFGRMLPRALAAFGCAVVCLDHVVKSGENRGRYALGGVHKLNGLDGAAFVLENRKPFGVGLVGISTIRLAKDRPGQLRKNGVPSKEGMFWFADLRLNSHTEGFLEVEIVPPEIKEQGEFRPTALMGQICAALEKHGPLSAAKIEAVVRGKAMTIRTARNLLQIEGFVSDGTPHALLKPWVEGDQND